MLALHDYYQALRKLPKMVVFPCKHPNAGIAIEVPNVYAAFGIDPLDVNQYANLKDMKQLLQQYLFESLSAKQDSVLGEFWKGFKYLRSSYHHELPRFDVSADLGVRLYGFNSGPQIKKNAGPDSVLLDKITFKVTSGIGSWLLEPRLFARYLHDRGLAVERDSETPVRSKFNCLSELMHSVEPRVVLAAQRAVLIAPVDDRDDLFPRTLAEKDQLEILCDLSATMGLTVQDTANLLADVVKASPQLSSYSNFQRRHNPVNAVAAEVETLLPGAPAMA